MSKLPRPFDRWTTYPNHGGIDYPEPMRTPILASGPGMVDFSGWYSSRGGYAKFITYDCGCRHGYYHLVNLSGLAVGQRVAEGDRFAFVGSTGFSTGPHLHHEVWINGAIIRPPAYWDYVDRDRFVGQAIPSGGGSKPLPIPEPAPTPRRKLRQTMYMTRNTVAEGGAVRLHTDNGSAHVPNPTARDIITRVLSQDPEAGPLELLSIEQDIFDNCVAAANTSDDALEASLMAQVDRLVAELKE